MATRAIQTIRNGMLAIGVCASLAVGGLGFAGSAEARVPEGDRVSDSAQICGWIQDQHDAAKERYRNAKTGSAAEAEAMKQMLTLLGAWQEQGCHGFYGTLNRLVVQPGITSKLDRAETINEVAPQTNPIAPSKVQNIIEAGGAIHTLN